LLILKKKRIQVNETHSENSLGGCYLSVTRQGKLEGGAEREDNKKPLDFKKNIFKMKKISIL
jgi:hypothetical protein